MRHLRQWSTPSSLRSAQPEGPLDKFERSSHPTAPTPSNLTSSSPSPRPNRSAMWAALALAGVVAFGVIPVEGSDFTTQAAHIPALEQVMPAPVKDFQLSQPVKQKGDYVAHGVNFSNLVSNQEFTDTSALSSDKLQSFLENRNSFLADFEVDSQTAAQVLVNVAKEEGLNPWILVTTMEKENSLVSRQREPGHRVLGAAMGYGHTDAGKRTGRNNNFENQLRRGAGLLKELYQEGQNLSYPHTVKVDFGKRKIKVQNAATLALMRYTPHTVDTSLRKVGGGNYLFRHILEDFTTEAAARPPSK